MGVCGCRWNTGPACTYERGLHMLTVIRQWVGSNFEDDQQSVISLNICTMWCMKYTHHTTITYFMSTDGQHNGLDHWLPPVNSSEIHSELCYCWLFDQKGDFLSLLKWHWLYGASTNDNQIHNLLMEYSRQLQHHLWHRVQRLVFHFWFHPHMYQYLILRCLPLQDGFQHCMAYLNNWAAPPTVMQLDVAYMSWTITNGEMCI